VHEKVQGTLGCSTIREQAGLHKWLDREHALEPITGAAKYAHPIQKISPHE